MERAKQCLHRHQAESRLSADRQQCPALPQLRMGRKEQWLELDSRPSHDGWICAAIGREIRKHDFYSIYFKNQDIMAILFRKHERLSNLAQNSVKRYILQLYINTAIRQDWKKWQRKSAPCPVGVRVIPIVCWKLSEEITVGRSYRDWVNSENIETMGLLSTLCAGGRPSSLPKITDCLSWTNNYKYLWSIIHSLN